tara:strand:+ start:1788 stop:3287 length:1500 start_codon:yes stop_codon:yes gene_type:complete
MTELVVSLGAGTLLIVGTGVALQSTQGLIKQSEGKTTLRQNTTNGLRLMRSEIERSMHLVMNRSEAIKPAMAHTNMSDPIYSRVLNQCQNLSTRPFKPIFGTKMIELTEPVIYGMTTARSGRGYSLMRCGAPLTIDGRYQETQDLFLSPVLENIGVIQCPKQLRDAKQCPESQPLEDVLNGLNYTFTAGKTPERTIQQPALRIETDENSKLVKFIDPTSEDDKIISSFVQNVGSGEKSKSTVATYFAAFARADKRINNNGDDGSGGVLSGAFFKNITSKRLRFVVDGSGSMSACVMWGEGYGTRRTYYDPNRGNYISTSRNCAFTRMEAMQGELTSILTDLSGDTKIGLEAFSTSGRANNKSWQPSAQRLVTISQPGMRESAISFVNTLDDPYPTYWGGTKPWNAIQTAFDDDEVDTLYLLSDGQPNKDRNGGRWTTSDYGKTAEYYADQNRDRSISLKVNTTSLGLSSPWMEQLSNLTAGEYNQIDQTTLVENSEEDT